MKHLLIILSFLLLSSFLTSCEKKNGPGTETYEDGSSYVGVFKDGERNGQGTYNYSDGDKYEGEWKDGKYHGQGTYTFKDGSKYVGEWKDDKYHGQGTWFGKGEWKGQKYEGEYKDGKEWNGKLYDKNGNIIGKYVNGNYRKP